MHEPSCVFDHAILAVEDLAVAAARFARLGFTLSPPGRHPSRGTVNACIMLPNGYLELLAADGPDCVETFLLEFLGDGEGLCSLALAPDDSTRVHALLAAWGAANGEPVIGGRAMETPTGPRDVRFRICRVTGRPILPGRVFFCEHLDRSTVYAPHLLRHDSGAQAIGGMTVLGDPAEVLDRQRAGALGLRRMDAGGIVVLQAGTVPLRIAPGTSRPRTQMSAPELRIVVADPLPIARAAAADGLPVVQEDAAVRVTMHGMDLVLASPNG
jgi:hypothetical protein